MRTSDTASAWSDSDQGLAPYVRQAILLVRTSPISLTLSALALLAFVVTYWSTFVSLVNRWNNDANYSHGYLVPLASLYLLHHSLSQRTDTRTIPLVGGQWIGSVLLVVALLLAWGTTIVPSLIGECASMLMAIAGAVLLVGGRSWWRHAWAPVLFLIFMVPWPSSLYSRAAFPLQLFVSQVASFFLQIGGIPVVCEGSLLHLPGQTMHVAQACSGLRQLTAFLAMACCASLFMVRPLWYRLTLLASAVPIAMIVNVLRVTVTGIMTYAGYGEMTEGAMHTAEGMVMILLGFGLMSLEIKLLDWIMAAPPTTETRRLAEAT